MRPQASMMKVSESAVSTTSGESSEPGSTARALPSTATAIWRSTGPVMSARRLMPSGNPTFLPMM